MRMLTTLILTDAVEKGGPGSGRYPAGSGDSLSSHREASAPKFVHAFIAEHSSGADAKAYLKTVSDDKLRIAAKGVEGHLDVASKLVSDYVHGEASRRGLKL